MSRESVGIGDITEGTQSKHTLRYATRSIWYIVYSMLHAQRSQSCEPQSLCINHHVVATFAEQHRTCKEIQFGKALAHLVLTVPTPDPRRILRLHLVIDHDIQISAILLVGSTRQAALYFLSRLHRQHIGKVEDCLLPVGVLRVRAGGEADWFVACGEFDVEPGDQSVYVVGAADVESERKAKVHVCGSTGVEIEGEDGGRVGDDGFEFDGVDEWFGKGGHFEGCVIEAVDVIPDCAN